MGLDTTPQNMHLRGAVEASRGRPTRLRVVKHTGIRTARRPRRAVPFASGATGAVAAGLLGVALTGCSALSPATIATPYAAADGVEGSLTNAADGSTISLRNMLIVAASATAEKGAGNLVGTITNSGDKPVDVQVALTPESPDQQPVNATVTVPANGALQLGTPEMSIVLVDVPAAGRMASITVQTQGGGRDDLTVPVMAPQDFYATLTPAPVTTPSATSS